MDDCKVPMLYCFANLQMQNHAKIAEMVDKPYMPREARPAMVGKAGAAPVRTVGGHHAGPAPGQSAPQEPPRPAPGGFLDITPDKSLIRKLGSTGYRTYDAISELVDNSIDARGGRKIVVKVSVGYVSGSIGVEDDGTGMDLAELRDAMTVAKEAVHPRGKRLGMFGLGMKTACSFLGRSFSVATSRAGSGTEYIVDYDEDCWEGDASVGWKSLPYRTRKKQDPAAHGTRVRIGRLRVPVYAEQTTVFKKRLGERYAEYMRQGQAEIRINRVTCEPVSHKVADGSIREFKVETSAGPVPAWIGMLERRSVTGSYGIDLYYRNRLIKMHSKFGIRSHPDMARIVGRISLDHVPVNFHKTDFIAESAEYAEAERAFREHPEVREAARAQRPGRGDGAAAAAGVHGYLFGRTDDPAPVALRMGRDASERLLGALRPARFRVGGRTVRIDYADSGGAPYAIDARGPAVRVTVNRKSRLFSAVANPLYLVALAVAEARALCIIEGGMGDFLGERSRIWTRTVEGWLPEKRGPAAEGRRQRRRAALAGYRVSRRLEGLESFLAGRYEIALEFSGLSTLEWYTHNVIGTPIYSLYTEKGQGGYLRDLVMEHDGAFVPVVGPNGDAMRELLDANRGRPFVAIREYAKGGLRQGLAPPATAWMDLLREARLHHMPMLDEDLAAILMRLRERGLVDISELEAVAKRRGKMSDLREFADDVFGRRRG